MNEKNDRHVIDILFVIALFCAFVVSAVFLITIGAKVYSSTIDHMNQNFDSRTAVAYIIEKIHHSDAEGNISVGKFEENDAIIISSQINDTEYLTYIYEFEGELKELLIRKDLVLSPHAGQSILPIDSFSVSEESSGLIKCSILPKNGENYEFYITSHTGGGANE